LTAHMFPGAHPMRRVLTRVIVNSDQGMIDVDTSTGNSIFTNITNTVQPLQGKTLHDSALASVPVNNNGSDALTFPGKVPDLNGSAISSQKFDLQTVAVKAVDATVLNQVVSASGTTSGTLQNAAIVDSGELSNFTRIYGHETGKKYDATGSLENVTGTFVVRPGFDSNMVENDNRLSPNETETYTLTYDITGKTGVTVTYKVYYMQKGANGKFLVDSSTGFLDQALSDSKKLLVTEVASHTEAL
ncbi:MAG: hypothetical protein WBM70_08090, partial [Sulfurovum sp.]|uniref:hypothetical protein n=1 Tax=Sulfurovum sp. TaxID=1969726 RepID=UPI003C71AF5F